MRYVLTACSVLLAACEASPESSSSINHSEDAVSNAVGAALQGDAQRALNFLSQAEEAALNSRSLRFKRCMLDRFSRTAPEPLSPVEGEAFAWQLTALFRDYWHSALLNPQSRDTLTRSLEQQLRELLDLPASTQIQEIENAVRERLEADGVHVLLGQTGVLRELMIWRQEDRRAVRVEMPHGVHHTQVAFLDDFLVRGWGQYSTCEARSAGGWVADRTLFAVVPAYNNLEGENFRVTFLGHETQHFLDLDTYPDMQPWELEYRAKLMELAMADETRPAVLQRFIEDQGDDPDSPHSYANRRLLAALVNELDVSGSDALRFVEGDVMRATAVSLYDADTALRNAP